MNRYLILFIIIAISILTGCDYASDPVRLGKQTVSEANAYTVRTEADQAALDAEQARMTRERQDAITVQERAQREAITTQQIGKVAGWMGLALVIAALGIGLSVAIVSLGASTATAINQNARSTREMARALGEFRRAAELHPGPTGIFPGLVLPSGVNVKVLTPGTNGVLDSRTPQLPSSREQARFNELAARAAIASGQVMAGDNRPIVMAQAGQAPRQIVTAQAVESEQGG